MKKDRSNAKISGYISKLPVLKTIVGFGDVYEFTVTVQRSSTDADVIPCYCNKDTVREFTLFEPVTFKAQLRSRNTNGGHLKHYLWVWEFLDAEEEPRNEIHIVGTICKKPIKRETPRGAVITDLMLAVQLGKENVSFIPCICWYDKAKHMAKMKKGDKISCNGRFQSRIFTKKIDDTEEVRITYEVSIKDFEGVRQ